MCVFCLYYSCLGQHAHTHRPRLLNAHTSCANMDPLPILSFTIPPLSSIHLFLLSMTCSLSTPAMPLSLSPSQSPPCAPVQTWAWADHIPSARSRTFLFFLSLLSLSPSAAHTHLFSVANTVNTVLNISLISIGYIQYLLSSNYASYPKIKRMTISANILYVQFQGNVCLVVPGMRTSW